MAKVVCESCGSNFLYDIAKSMELCPVCGKPLWYDGNSEHKEEPSFGEGIELGENDSFDEDKIDFWWYSIREPGTLDEDDKGSVSTTCAKCGYLSGITSYHIARVSNYLLLSPRIKSKCSHCGNELKNHILSKRPADWVDPRKSEMWTKDYQNMPKCPVCGSVKIHKITITNKTASAIAFGIFAVGHVSKTWQCDICKSKF